MNKLLSLVFKEEREESVTKSNDYYMSRIQVLEKALAEMRCKKRQMQKKHPSTAEPDLPTTAAAPDSSNCSSSGEKAMVEPVVPPPHPSQECAAQESPTSAVNHVSSSCLESLESRSCDFQATTGANNEIVVNDTSLDKVQEENMNYFKSRFLRQDAFQRSNPFNTAESVLRDYRHRRRHRQNLSKLIAFTNEDEEESPTEEELSICQPNGPPQVEKSNSFRRKRNESDEENPFAKRKLEHKEENEFVANPVLLESIVANVEVSEPVQVEIVPTIEEVISIPRVVVEPDSQPEDIKEEEEDEEEDPLSFIQIKSAAQWKAVSKRISWNFDEHEKEVGDEKELLPQSPTPTTKSPEEPLIPKQKENDQKGHETPTHDYDNIQYDVYCPEYDNSVSDFKPTKVQQLRLICWKIKPWKQPKPAFGQPRLFSSTFAAPWGADCDEVHPGLFIGDKASATNVAFLKRYGITHVLNAAEGAEEGLVDLSAEHYDGSNITYLGFPLWDAPGCNLMPYLGIAADYIYSAIDAAGGKCLVNCQMGVSRSASCALAYLMIHRGMTAVEGLTLIRKSRDCRPNDGFLTQLINLDNQLRLEREHSVPRKVRLSTLQDKYRLPLSWHNEFWIPNEVSEEELGFPLVPMGNCILSLKLQSTYSPSLSRKSNSVKTSRSSSKRNSFKAGLCSESKAVSRRSSFKRSRPASICPSVKSDLINEDNDWEWVWETDDEEEEEEEEETKPLEQKLQEVKTIITKPEERWRKLPRPVSRTSSSRSSYCQGKGTLSAQAGVEENDPLSIVKVASAKQWKTISRKLTINFDDLEEDAAAKTPKATTPEPLPTPMPSTSEKTPFISNFKSPFEEAFEEAKKAKAMEEATEANQASDQSKETENFKPTTVQELRRLCWQIKPWDQPRKTFAERQLFTSILGTPWGVDADEVHPKILVGDQAAAKNIAFLKRFGISHVLNAAEGPWTEHCVDLCADHYEGTGITYLGLPLWDSTDAKILQYLGCAADFIRSALENGQKCLVNCQMGVSRSCSAAMAYLMIYEDMNAVEILRTFRKRRDVRPNDFFMDQLVELDNDLRKKREYGIPRKLLLPSLEQLPSLPKPWHFEFWNEVPDDLPFNLTHLTKRLSIFSSSSTSKRQSLVSNGSEWEWEYYSDTEEDSDNHDDSCEE